jgi:hypothetical protein
MVSARNTRVDMSHVRTDKDRIELFNIMLDLVRSTIRDANKTDYIVLNVVKQLDKEDIHYEGKFHSFSNFINKIAQDTKRGFLGGAPILKDGDQLKTILVKIFTAITSVISKKEISKEVDRFLENEYGYEISNKKSVNILNLLVNYHYYDKFDTLRFLDIIYPELASEIQAKKIADPPQVLNVARNDSRGKPASQYPKRSDPPPSGGQAGGSRRSKKSYPFTRRRSRTRRHR